MKLPEPIEKLKNELSELPSIGPRQAIRMAFFLAGGSKDKIKKLADAISGLSEIKTCERCFFIHKNKNGLCDICSDARRRQNVIAIVEKETDLISVENTGKFNGRYLIIGAIRKSGLLDNWQKLRLQNLKAFIQKDFGSTAEEIILAFNPTAMGDLAASIIAKDLASYAKTISRLGRGLPTGGEIEFADDETLGSALERRS